MTQLIQEKGFHYQCTTLRDEDILVKTKSFERDTEYSINYHEIGLRSYRAAERNARIWEWLLLGVVIAMGVLLLFAHDAHAFIHVQTGITGIALSVLGIVWIRLRQEPEKLYLLGGEQQLSVLADVPSAEVVSDFVDAVGRRVKAAHQQQFEEVHTDMGLEEKRQHLNMLYEMKVLTKEEKDTQLAQLAPGRGKGIGFRKGD